MTETLTHRPPVIVIMGHVDHGKSTLLDYIRKSNVVEGEAGGITQHISAYEVEHEKDGEKKKITFLDTPGHESFGAMRARGSQVADIAVLVVSAEDAVMPQTLEALSAIKESEIPYIVAINKIDTPKANVERTKASLIENGIYIEGMGGDVPCVAISAKTGEGVPELLDMMLLVAELEELTGNREMSAQGVVIEAALDARKGISATLIIKDGTLSTGMHLLSGKALAPVRIMEDFTGKKITEASFSSPIRIIGWDEVPPVGGAFQSFDSKKDAQAALLAVSEERQAEVPTASDEEDTRTTIPIILKADVLGSLDAIKHEIAKIDTERVNIRIVSEGVGSVSENDVKLSLTSENALIVGFNVKVDSAAADLAERNDTTVHTFDIIYKLAEWLTTAIVERTPKVKTKDVTGSAKILKLFSVQKNKYVLGGRVESGTITQKGIISIARRGNEIGEGKILSLQTQKSDVKEVTEGNEFGAQIESRTEIAPGDIIENFIITEK